MTFKGDRESHGVSFLSHPFCSVQFAKDPHRVKKKKIIVISGPTAVGKTELSLQIAKIIGGEIISADSMQVYRGMDIGTAKVSKEERKTVSHHLLDIHDIKDRFNVVDFYHEAMAALHYVDTKGAVPIVVGGTGFYLHALLYGPPPGPASDPKLRMQLEEEMDRLGLETFYDKLTSLDPEYAATISRGDKQKMLRGMEIIALTGQKVSSSQASKDQEEDVYDFRCWFLYMPKEKIYDRIETRCQEMVEDGLLEEVKRLKAQGLEQNSSAAQAIGYRQALEYLHTRQTPEDWQKFLATFKQASRGYAKRQFTWFRKEPLFRWIDVTEVSQDALLEIIIQDYEIGL